MGVYVGNTVYLVPAPSLRSGTPSSGGVKATPSMDISLTPAGMGFSNTQAMDIMAAAIYFMITPYMHAIQPNLSNMVVVRTYGDYIDA